MEKWSTFSKENPSLAECGKRMLFRETVGKAFIATLRKDGAPRVIPISMVFHQGLLYVLIPRSSP